MLTISLLIIILMLVIILYIFITVDLSSISIQLSFHYCSSHFKVSTSTTPTKLGLMWFLIHSTILLRPVNVCCWFSMCVSLILCQCSIQSRTFKATMDFIYFKNVFIVFPSMVSMSFLLLNLVQVRFVVNYYCCLVWQFSIFVYHMFTT